MSYNFRNPKYNAVGGIDCEIEHPNFGWIPFSSTEESYPDFHSQLEGADPAEYVAPPPPEPPTAAELDALADVVAEQVLEQNAQMKAIGLVMADLVEATFNVSQNVARQQVKTRFRNYYRSLIE